MREAEFWRGFSNKQVQCRLCPKYCMLKPDEIGNCGARQNKNGKLISLVYGKPISIHIDPVEKKPLYHFFPGSKVLSIGTVGCNFHCLHCQNWEISQTKGNEVSVDFVEPKEIVEIAKKQKCKSIAYTYNEPTIFYEYVFEIAKLASRKGIYNILVSNGYINPEPLNKLLKHIDAANIDLKAINEKFYKEICDAHIAPVLLTLKTLHRKKVHLEITNLIIPLLNDRLEDIKKLCEWIKINLSPEIPIHFSAFYPTYKLLDKPRTSLKTLRMAYDIAKQVGLKHIYLGNVLDPEHEATYCSKCNKALIRRSGFELIENKINKGKCECKKQIYGYF